MATVQVRMDETVKQKFDEFVIKLNAFRLKKKQSQLTNAQILELVLENTISKGDLLK